MQTTKERLAFRAQILDQIDAQREIKHARDFAKAMETEIVNNELTDLERDIVADPGALEAYLVRIRPNRRDQQQ